MRLPTLLTLSLLSATSASAQSPDPIRIGQPNWFAGELIAKILANVIEAEFDVAVELVPGSNPELFGGMVADTPTVDIHTDTWMPNHASWVNPAVAAGTMALSQSAYPGVDAMCVPQYVSEQYDIRSVDDLISERGREIFDIDADGRGDIWIGAEGWGSTRVMQVKMEGYGLSAELTPMLMSEGDWQEILFDRMAAREPVAFYCYQPHVWFAYDYITVLEEPPHDPANWQLVSPEESENWIAESNITSADDIKDVQITYATRLRDSHPEVAGFLSQFGVSGEAMTELIFLAQVKEIGLEFVVEDWIAVNQPLIDDWVAGARQG
ncbi:glycine betaine ABC transporter substrate-binding protein [Pontivivens insulae]|nr:glycine betaine ABC transporter substrate-binding protein [Pontivivens insulae]